MADTPHVVVVGAGFAGLAATRRLARGGARITLVDRNAYTTFQPLLYQVATAGLAPGDVAYSTRVFAARYPGVRAVRGRVSKLRPAERRLELDDGTGLDYDYLVLASGVTTNWLGIEGAERNALPLYALDDARTLRRRLQQCLEQTALGARNGTHVVVVGGGATGVEMAGTLAELRRRTIALTHPEISPQQTSVTLVERLDHLLAPYKPNLRAAAARALRTRGVDLRLGASVAEVTEDAVILADGGRIPSDLTVWALGVTAPKDVADWGLPQGKGGRIAVTEALNIAEHPEIFVAGDLAGAPEPTPQLAQPALQMGAHVAEQILSPGKPAPFRYRDRGTMATIGRAEAVLQLRNGWTMHGWPAWLAWIALHVAYLLGGRNRANVLINFFWRYGGPRRTAVSAIE